jgi:hypothetical protein
MSPDKPKPKPVNYDHAAYRADWMQVVLNQGPPCFYLGDEPDRFCLRAERWDGHTDKDKYPEHRFVSLAALLDKVRDGAVAEERRALQDYWSDIEARSADAHAAYQAEAHRRGDVRHADAYADLPEATKEWDRVLIRWILAALAAREAKP